MKTPAFEFRSLADGDHPEVVVRGGHRDMSIPDILELFEHFLRGCGYVVPFGSLNMGVADKNKSRKLSACLTRANKYAASLLFDFKL